ncbi:hypothetical protein CHS0354_028334 [Potamilus streckersoni]|uniref:Uncharacterized protein n=1 Tax=Potamilus streckersoni TaxID=2493646 RepID=A0AAE0VIG9_9BIVA|nr:hypothetical protein CHS0354_028334 [Potamilus streckersoni]
MHKMEFGLFYLQEPQHRRALSGLFIRTCKRANRAYSETCERTLSTDTQDVATTCKRVHRPYSTDMHEIISKLF